MIKAVLCTILAITLFTALDILYGMYLAWATPILLVFLYKLYSERRTRIPMR